jgi:peptidoglycan/LPS O-acetylase OafA/YrhL
LRGVAALAVLAFHVDFSIGDVHLFKHGYLAVDFFFLLSGFVIGAAYERRLTDGLSTPSYLGLRLKRLYPMIVLGAGLGLIAAMFRDTAYNPWLALALQLALIPYALTSSAYPLNYAQWSLFYELLINLIHAWARPLATNRVLAWIAVASGLGLFLAETLVGTLDLGNFREEAWGGLLRVAFSFSAGLLIFRLHQAGRLPVFRLPLILPVAALTLVLIQPAYSPIPSAVFVTLVFPVILIVTLSAELRPGAARPAELAGAISYPLYLTHAPVVNLARLAGLKPDDGVAGFAYWVVAVAAIILLSWLVERVYEAPIRRALA